MASFNFSESVTFIGDGIFSGGCLCSITFPPKVTVLEHGVCFCCKSLTAVNILGNVTEIDFNSFSQCNLQSIDIWDTTSSIGEYSFYNNAKLETLKLPSSLSYIGTEYTFAQSGIKSLTFPEKLLTFPKYAFYRCYSLSSVTFYGNVKSFA